MAVFLVMGLELKRELLVGELSSPRQALLPIMAAIGGMLVPALCYVVLNPDGPAAKGWVYPGHRYRFCHRCAEPARPACTKEPDHLPYRPGHRRRPGCSGRDRAVLYCLAQPGGPGLGRGS